MGSGYLYVVSHRGLARGERKIAAARRSPAQIVARWNGLAVLPHPLKLHAVHFVFDLGAARARLETTLKEQSARGPFGDPARPASIRRRDVAPALRATVEADRSALAQRLGPETDLFSDPGTPLTGATGRLVAEIADQLAPFHKASYAPLFLTPFGIGLLGSLIMARANHEAMPPVLLLELYRAVAAAVWGQRPSNREMIQIRTIMRDAPAAYRLGVDAFNRHIAGPLQDNPLSPVALERLRAYVGNPRRFTAEAADAYAADHYVTLGFRTVNAGLKFIRIALFFLAVAVLSVLALGPGGEGAFRTLIAVFLLGLAAFSMGWFRSPDPSRLMGLIPLDAWRSLRDDLDEFPVALTPRIGNGAPGMAVVPVLDWSLRHRRSRRFPMPLGLKGRQP